MRNKVGLSIAAMLSAIIGVLHDTANAQSEGDAFLSGNQFVRQCEGAVGKRIQCLIYVLGVYHGSQSQNRSVCLPAGVDTGQLYEVAIAYIRNNPARAHFVPFGLMLDSWQQAFPCRAGE